MAEFRAIVSGRVQMVMYRDFVTRKARRLALTGFVRNLTNGTVEVVAQGYEDNLQKLIEYLHKGPFLAKVAHVQIEWRDPQKHFDSFGIVY
ncbi:MAG: acylphosphatase [Patescibacteria group bacterium]